MFSVDDTAGFSRMALSPFVDLVPMLLCADVPASVRFYTDVLGFEVVDRMDDVGATGFASLRNGKAMVMLASPTYIPRAPRVDGRYRADPRRAASDKTLCTSSVCLRMPSLR